MLSDKENPSALLEELQSPETFTCIMPLRTSPALLWFLLNLIKGGGGWCIFEAVIFKDRGHSGLFHMAYRATLKEALWSCCCPRVTLFSGPIWAAISWEALKVRGAQGKAIRRGCWEGVRLQGLSVGPASLGTARWAGEAAGCPRGHEWQGPFEGCVTLPEPHPASAHHIWTPLKATPAAPLLPGRGAVTWELLQQLVRAPMEAPLVQTGSRCDPQRPGSNTALRTVTIGLGFYVCQTALGPFGAGTFAQVEAALNLHFLHN